MKYRNPTVKLLTLSALALLVSFQDNLLLNSSLTLFFLLLLLVYLPLKKLLKLLFLLSLSAVGIFLPGYYFSKKVKTAARQRHMPMAFVSPVAFIVLGH